jgi:hypothetical protein
VLGRSGIGGEHDMSNGVRVTDEVTFWQKRGDLRRAVRVVRERVPERLRWRSAVSSVAQTAGGLVGAERVRVEEPVREVVLDLNDKILRREVVIDARRFGVDFDRFEILPVRTRWDLTRTAYLTGLEPESIERYLSLPADFGQPIDTAGVAVISRALASNHKRRADTLVARLGETGGRALAKHEQIMLERADHERDRARRWAALCKTLLEGSR